MSRPIPDIQSVPVKAKLSAPVALVTRPTRTRTIINNGDRNSDRCGRIVVESERVSL